MMATISAMLPKRLARFGLVTFLLVTVAIVYVTLFKHPPPDQVLKMNSGGAGGKSFSMRGFETFGKSHHDTGVMKRSEDDEERGGGGKEEDDGNSEEREKERNFFDTLEDDDDENEDGKDDRSRSRSGDTGDEDHAGKEKRTSTVEKEKARDEEADDRKADDYGEGKKGVTGGGGDMKGKAVWDKFIADNHHTVIGIVFDKCENPTEQLGTVVLLPDKENGGVMSRTFYNFTLDRVIDGEGWTFNIDVKYNGQDLYDNWWEVCEMEDDLDLKDRTFVCPVKPGRLSLVKDKHIPGYIPTGRYQSKAWVKDANNTVLVCGYSDFVL
ncbi:uncharacterized protein LOC143300393 [Babylonia areolata]|uniref:uncharacterized protein LOC143300393 n=1 Tax=Babylonia areolata TaxID=304850 RepID=UPI003FD3C286